MILSDKNYHGYIISLPELNMIMNHLININEIEYNLRKDSSITDNIQEPKSSIVKNNKCTISETVTLMHEIAHSFDISLNNELIEKNLNLTSKFDKIYPPATFYYLSETTAIFFESLFSDYLVSQKPGLSSVIDNIKRERIKSDLNSAKRTQLLSAIARVIEEKGEIPDDFIDKVIGNETNPKKCYKC